MSSNVLISDIAKAAGVADSTVSLVLNGKGDRVRIRKDTQVRIRNLASQMGYQPHQLARDVALGRGVPKRPPVPSPGSSPISEVDQKSRKIGLIFSATSPVESFALLPDQVPVLVAADYRVEIMKVSSESCGASEWWFQFIAEGAMGVLCCPTIYAAVLEAVAGKVPVIVLWKGGAKSLLAKIMGVAAEEPPAEAAPPTPVPAPRPVVLTPPVSGVVTPKPVSEVTPVVPDRVAPEPLVSEPIPVVSEVMPLPVIAAEPVVMPEPVIIEPTPALPPDPVPTPEVAILPVSKVINENEAENPDDPNPVVVNEEIP